MSKSENSYFQTTQMKKDNSSYHQKQSE